MGQVRYEEEPVRVIKLLIENGRPITIIAPVLIITIHYFLYITELNFEAIVNYILLVFGVISLRMGINNVNNAYDLEVDRINKPHRPIPRGELQKDTAFITGIIIQFISLFAFMLIDIRAFMLCLSFVIVGWLYNIDGGLKNYFPINNLTIGYVRGFGFLLAIASTGSDIETIHVAFALAITFYIFGSVNSKDINDVEGDKKMNRQTLPILLGRYNKYLGYFAAPFILTPVFVFVIFAALNVLPPIYYLLLLVLPLDIMIIYFINKASTTRLVENNVAWLFMIITYLSHHIIFGYILTMTK